MRPSRLVLPLALASAVLLTGHAGAAAPAALVLPDAANDGNAINGQLLSGEPIPDGTVTPVGSQPDKDFTSVKLEATSEIKKKKRVCTGFTATATLSGPPATANTIYRITGQTKTNAGRFWLTYNGAATNIVHAVDSAATTTATTLPLKKPAVLKGNTLSFIVLDSDLKAAGEVVSAFTWTALGAHSRTQAVAATAPLWDSVIVDEAKTFSLC